MGNFMERKIKFCGLHGSNLNISNPSWRHCQGMGLKISAAMSKKPSEWRCQKDCVYFEEFKPVISCFGNFGLPSSGNSCVRCIYTHKCALYSEDTRRNEEAKREMGV